MNFSDEFQNGETFLRGVLPYEQFWNIEQNRTTSAVFKDSKGMSVNRTGEDKQCFKESLECLKSIHENKFKAIAEVTVELCKSLELYLIYKPESNNVYHSEIHKSESEPVLTKSSAKKLAETCKVII